tara:strand:- start:329 stop:1750 length:1422 start_codon:yes stop_codon:yes gene_type:complete
MSALLSKNQIIHFSGICGTGMASLAVLLKLRGYEVRGSDENVYPPMSDFLLQNNIEVLNGFSQKNINSELDLVVIGNALSRGNPEIEEILESKIPYISMSELLKRYFISGKTSLVVSGTHGKTTTSSLLAWVFETAKLKPGFFLGGIAENFRASCRDGKGEFFISEGDEYDTAFFDKRSKFLHYLPDQLILNNLEFDHADIFDSIEDIRKTFRLLLRLIPEKGIIVANGDDENVLNVLESAYSKKTTFGFGKNCDFRAINIKNHLTGTTFEIEDKKNIYSNKKQNFTINLFGSHNVLNALGVIILSRYNSITDKDIQESFDSFKSVKRRQEFLGEVNGISVYDDFAHHPTAIGKTISAIKQRHPRRRLIAVFEPRSNTSVLNKQKNNLIKSFLEADEVIFSELYRIEKIPMEKRLDIKNVLLSLQNKNIVAHQFSDVSTIINYLKTNCKSGDIVLIMSNGKFENIHQRLLEKL